MPNRIVKTTVLLSSCFLAGMYLLSAGGFIRLPGLSAADDPTTQPKRRMMPGSKSANHDLHGQNVLFSDEAVNFAPTTHPTTQPATLPATQPIPSTREFFHGSKSGFVRPK